MCNSSFICIFMNRSTNYQVQVQVPILVIQMILQLEKALAGLSTLDLIYCLLLKHLTNQTKWLLLPVIAER